MASLNLTIDRGTTLDPVALVVWADSARTERVDLTGASAVAKVRNRRGDLIADLQPSIQPAADFFPTVSNGDGAPLGGDVVVIEASKEITATFSDGNYGWDCVVTLADGTCRKVIEGDFDVDVTKALN